MEQNQIIDFFQSLIGEGKMFASNADIVRFLNIPVSQASKFYNFLKGADTQYKIVFEWFKKIGGTINNQPNITTNSNNEKRLLEIIEKQKEQIISLQAELKATEKILNKVLAGNYDTAIYNTNEKNAYSIVPLNN